MLLEIRGQLCRWPVVHYQDHSVSSCLQPVCATGQCRSDRGRFTLTLPLQSKGFSRVGLEWPLLIDYLGMRTDLPA